MVTKWESTKKVPDGLDATIEGATIKVIELTVNGNRYRISGTYGLDLQVPAKPKLVTKYHLTGNIKGIAVSEYFDDDWSAKQRQRELCDCGDEFKVEKVEVPDPEES